MRLTLVVVLLAASSELEAQTCFFAKRNCRTSFISEFGILREFENQNLSSSIVNGAYWELGAMTKLGDRSALGVVAYYSFADANYRSQSLWSVKLRIRRWLTPDVAFDLSAGPLLGKTLGYSFPWRLTLPGLTTRIDLSFADWFGLIAGLDLFGFETAASWPSEEPALVMMRYRDERETWHVGARVGKHPGLIIGGLSAILIPTVIAIGKGLRD